MTMSFSEREWALIAKVLAGHSEDCIRCCGILRDESGVKGLSKVDREGFDSIRLAMQIEQGIEAEVSEEFEESEVLQMRKVGF